MEINSVSKQDSVSGQEHTGSDTNSSINLPVGPAPEGRGRGHRRPLRRGDLTPAVIARFHLKVQRTPSCWLWTGTKESHGYGQVYTGLRPDGKKDRHYAHRVAYVLALGDVPGDLEVMHGCDIPSCVNPGHLTLGTHQQNIADRDRRGRTKKTSPRIRKIDAQGVRDIRAMRHIPPADFARQYGVDVSHIKHIRTGRRRKVD